MKNLVIGSSGFIGKYFCKYLEKKGEQVVRFDIKRNKKEDARFAKLPLKEIDKVYFLAWDVGGAKYLHKENTQLKQLEWNTALLLNVMPQLRKVPFVFVSSQLAEDNTVYGVTKKLGELWTKQLKGCYIRLENVYGMNEKTGERSHVISDFVNQAKKGKIKMLSSGEEKRRFTHIEDACNALYSANKWVSIRDVADIVTKLTLEEGIRKMI